MPLVCARRWNGWRNDKITRTPFLFFFPVLFLSLSHYELFDKSHQILTGTNKIPQCQLSTRVCNLDPFARHVLVLMQTNPHSYRHYGRVWRGYGAVLSADKEYTMLHYSQLHTNNVQIYCLTSEISVEYGRLNLLDQLLSRMRVHIKRNIHNLWTFLGNGSRYSNVRTLTVSWLTNLNQ